MAGGGFGDYWAARDPSVALGFAPSPHKKEAEDRANQASQDLYQKTGQINQGLDSSTQKYLQGMQGYTSEAQNDLKGLRDKADAAATDARNTYSNTIQPRLKDSMEKLGASAAGAMSLQDAMDPNNKVATGVRNLYNTEAANEGRGGAQAASLAQSLGAQNFASQIGNMGPLSGGQLAALMGQNQAQAGLTMGASQQRQQQLRDTGLAQGFARSDTAFEQGREATGDYQNSIYGLNNANRQNDQDQARYRQEHAGYGQDLYNLGTGYLGTQQSAAQQKAARDQAAASGYYGGIRETSLGQARDYAAEQEKKMSTLGGGVNALANFGGQYMSKAADKSKTAESSSEYHDQPKQSDSNPGAKDTETFDDSAMQDQNAPGNSPGNSAGTPNGTQGAFLTGGNNNRMATRSISQKMATQGKGGGDMDTNNAYSGSGGRLLSMMGGVPHRDWSKEDAAYKAAQPQRDADAAQQKMQSAQDSIFNAMHGVKKPSLKGGSTPAAPRPLTPEEQRKQNLLNKGLIAPVE